MTKLMKSILEQIQDLVNCSCGQFFIFVEDIITLEDKKQYQISSIFVENQYINVFTLDETNLQDASFESIEEAKNMKYSKQYQYVPFFDQNGNLMASLQIESKFKFIKEEIKKYIDKEKKKED